MTYILLLPGSKVPYSVDICKFESYHNVYHDRSIHQCLQRINRENWICMRKHQHQLDRIYLAYKVLSQLPQLNIRCLPFFMYFVSTNFWSSSYTLQASRIFTLFCLVFLPPPPPEKKNHPYQTRVLLPTKTPLLPTSIQSSSSSKSWEVVSKLEVGPMFLFGHETKIERQKNKINERHALTYSKWSKCMEYW